MPAAYPVGWGREGGGPPSARAGAFTAGRGRRGCPLAASRPSHTGGHHQVGAAHHVAAGETLGWRSGTACAGLGDHAAAARSRCDVVIGEPRLRIGTKPKATITRSAAEPCPPTPAPQPGATATGVGGPSSVVTSLSALDFSISHDLDRLAVPQELHAFLLALPTSRLEPGMFFSSRR